MTPERRNEGGVREENSVKIEKKEKEGKERRKAKRLDYVTEQGRQI